MSIYDVSLLISELLPVWPGDPPIRLTQPLHLDRGDSATVTRLDLGAHTGTHVDAAVHFVSGGSGIDALDLDMLVGPALVVHALEVDALSGDVLERLAIPAGTRRVLFRTRNSDLWARGHKEFDTNYVAVTKDGAEWLIDHGIQLVGVDYLSVAPFEDVVPTHRILLEAGVIPVEGLNLSEIEAGIYQLVCLPLKIAGSDGAPARVVLID
jgi:arylformamidase